MGEEGSTEQWWELWVQAGPVGAATWIGLMISVIGLIITIWGFLSAIRAANRAGKEATAAVHAVDRLKTSLRTSSLPYLHSQIGLLSQFVEGKHFYPAQVLLATVKRDIIHHANDVRTSTNDINDLKRRLQTASSHIGYAQRNAAKFKAHILQESIGSIQDTIVEWESRLRQKASEVPNEHP